MPLTIAFCVVAGLTALLLLAWALDRGTDPASRGIGGGYALVGLPFLVVGVLLFLLTRGAALRAAALVLAGVPLLAMGLMAVNARFGYLLDNYLKSPSHVFGSSAARDLGKAIERQDLAAIRRLAAAGADLNEIGRDRRSPLSFALDRNALDAAALLLELGADPTKGEGEGGRAPLTEMVSTDARSELLKAALKRGASPEFTDKWGVPMVHWAVTSRCTRNLEVLVAAGARLDRRDDGHQLASPLSCALDRREWACARYLVEHGAPVREAPGWNGLDAKFGNADPPAEGSPGRAEYDALVKAMVARGFAPPARPGAR